MRNLIIGVLIIVATPVFSYENTAWQEETTSEKGAIMFRRMAGGICFGFVGWTLGINLGHQYLPETELLSATSFALASTILGYSFPGELKETKLATGWLVATAISNATMWLTKDKSGFYFIVSLPLNKCLWDMTLGRRWK